jgi:hypothetical protein
MVAREAKGSILADGAFLLLGKSEGANSWRLLRRMSFNI